MGGMGMATASPVLTADLHGATVGGACGSQHQRCSRPRGQGRPEGTGAAPHLQADQAQGTGPRHMTHAT